MQLKKTGQIPGKTLNISQKRGAEKRSAFVLQ